MNFFLLLALVGFVTSAVVHASTFFPVPPLGIEQTWPLHLGIFVVFVPGFLTQRRRGRAAATPDAERLPHRSPARDATDAPRWPYAALAVVGCYAVVNFCVGMKLLGLYSGEKIVDRDGGHMMIQRGSGAFVREVDDAEYRRDEGRSV
jgi:hypothetical protein